jgi:hypothetical protein
MHFLLIIFSLFLKVFLCTFQALRISDVFVALLKKVIFLLLRPLSCVCNQLPQTVFFFSFEAEKVIAGPERFRYLKPRCNKVHIRIACSYFFQGNLEIRIAC